MPKSAVRNLNAVSRTLMIPLYLRALESRRPNALLRDPRAEELVGRLDYDFSHVITSRKEGENVSMLLRMREFDRLAAEFLARHPDGTVVDLGCGLDTRFDRIDNGRMEWFGVDLPEVIALRRELLGATPRSRFIGCSVLDFSWMDALTGRTGKPVLFLAEAVLYYLYEGDVKALVRALAGRFPGAGLIFDAFSPLVVRSHPHTPDVPPVHWGLRDDRDLESWAPGIRLTGRSFYLEQPEQRLGAFRILRYLPFLGRAVRIVQYRLGDRQAGH
jgi:O-methyltransferase involved in polyketide biosynthesis